MRSPPLCATPARRARCSVVRALRPVPAAVLAAAAAALTTTTSQARPWPATTLRTGGPAVQRGLDVLPGVEAFSAALGPDGGHLAWSPGPNAFPHRPLRVHLAQPRRSP